MGNVNEISCIIAWIAMKKEKMDKLETPYRSLGFRRFDFY